MGLLGDEEVMTRKAHTPKSNAKMLDIVESTFTAHASRVLALAVSMSMNATYVMPVLHSYVMAGCSGVCVSTV